MPPDASSSSQWMKKKSSIMDYQFELQKSNVPFAEHSIPGSISPPGGSFPNDTPAYGLQMNIGLPPSYFHLPSSLVDTQQTPMSQEHWNQGANYPWTNPPQYTMAYTDEPAPLQPPTDIDRSSIQEISASSTSSQPASVEHSLLPHIVPRQQPLLGDDATRIDVNRRSTHYCRKPQAAPVQPRSSPSQNFTTRNAPPQNKMVIKLSDKTTIKASSQPNLVKTPSYSSIVVHGRPKPPVTVPPNSEAATSTVAISFKQRRTTSIPEKPPIPRRPIAAASATPSSSTSHPENSVGDVFKKLPPHLKALAHAIIRSGCCVDGQVEPNYGSPDAETMRRQVASQGHHITVNKDLAGKSIYNSFINGGRCLICGENKKAHAMECVRRHMKHRPFVCTVDGCNTCTTNPGQGFHEYSRLKQHLDRPQQRATCGYCKKEFRQDNLGRHRCGPMQRSTHSH